MKKTLIPSVILLFSLFGFTQCTKYDAEPNGKEKSDYDISKNVEIDPLYYGECAKWKDFKMTARFKKFELNKYFQFVVWTTNAFITEYDIVDMYYCNSDGKIIQDILESPITYTFNKRDGNWNQCNYDLPNWLNNEEISELRVITEDCNLTFHLWDAPTNVEPNGKSKEEYKYQNIREERLLWDNEYLGDKARISCKNITGKWIDDTLRLKILARENFDIYDVFASDLNGNDKMTLLNEPVSFSESLDHYFFDIKGLSDEWLAKHNNQIKIDVFIDGLDVTFYSSEYH